MQEHEPFDAVDERQADLTAAAEALVAWMHVRREAWAGQADVVVPMRRPPVVARPVPSAPPLEAVMPPPQITYEQLAPLPEPPADFAPAPPVAAAPQVVASPPVPEWRPLEPFVYLPEPAVPLESADVKQAVEADRRHPIQERAKALGAPLLRWSLRVGGLAAVLGIVASAGWFARPYYEKLTTTVTMGTAVVESVPPGAAIFVDGVAAGTAPMKAELKAGHHVIEFRRRKDVRKMEIDVTAGGSTAARLDWNAVVTGRLVVNSDPAGSHVVVDGHDSGDTPLTLDLAVGSHAVLIKNDQGSVRRTVAITADHPVQLSESIYAGLLKVFAPFDLQITENGHSVALDDQNQVMLPSGRHDLQIENRASGFRQTSHVDVEPGVTTSLSVVPPPSALSVTSTLPATVVVDGEAVGETPLSGAPIKIGTREIVVKSASGVERTFTMTVTVKPVQLDVDFSQP